MVLNRERKNYEKSTFTSKSDYDKQWDKVESANTMRNVFYGVGGGLIGTGLVILFVF